MFSARRTSVQRALETTRMGIGLGLAAGPLNLGLVLSRVGESNHPAMGAEG